jgi:hypothetical protein
LISQSRGLGDVYKRQVRTPSIPASLVFAFFWLRGREPAVNGWRSNLRG